jgi:hypothetical protein
MDIDGRAQVVENLIERSESRVVAPAVDIRRFDVEHFLAEAFGDELGETGLARPTWTGDDSRLGWLAARNRFEDARKVVDFGVTMLDFSGNEAGAEDASIANHLIGGECFRRVRKTYPRRFREESAQICVRPLDPVYADGFRVLASPMFPEVFGRC